MPSDSRQVELGVSRDPKQVSADTSTARISVVLEYKLDIEAHDRDCEDLVVSWEGDGDPNNPHNWPLTRKLTMATILSLGGLVSTMSTSMMAPALLTISSDLHLGPSATQLTLSIYLLAFVLGPLVIAPFSEMYGRKIVWLFCHSWYILWNSICPVGKSVGVMVAGRFLSGFGGCVGQSIAGVTVSDLFPPSQRGKSLAFVNAAPYLGAAIGPILGGVVAQHISWPWLFWTVSMFDMLIVLLSLFFVHESYAPVLLARKAAKLRKATGREYYTKYEVKHETLSRKLVSNLSRPLRLFVTRPVIPFVSVLLAYYFGTYCIALSTFASIYTTRYHVSQTTSGLHYIAIALGSTIATQISGPLTDIIYASLKRKNGGKVTPECRVPLMLPAAILMPLGLLIYGWAVQHTWHWAVVDVGAAVFSGGVMMGSVAALAYLIDEFGVQAGSANAAVRILSNTMGFGFPIFAPGLYDTLGDGWGNTLLAVVGLVLGVPATAILWRWGPELRGLGKKSV